MTRWCGREPRSAGSGNLHRSNHLNRAAITIGADNVEHAPVDHGAARARDEAERARHNALYAGALSFRARFSRLNEFDDVGRSLCSAHQQHATHNAPKGQGDRGDC